MTHANGVDIDPGRTELIDDSPTDCVARVHHSLDLSSRHRHPFRLTACRMFSNRVRSPTHSAVLNLHLTEFGHQHGLCYQMFSSMASGGVLPTGPLPLLGTLACFSSVSYRTFHHSEYLVLRQAALGSSGSSQGSLSLHAAVKILASVIGFKVSPHF